MRYAPMLAVASAAADVREGFRYEFKWDGVRALVEVGADGAIELYARSGNVVTAAYPELKQLADAVGRPAVLDGEIVALGDDGRPSFEALQTRMYAGSVGSGFTDRMLRELGGALAELRTDTSPFVDEVPRRGDLSFVAPRLVVEVQFSQWTRDGVLRQPSFKGLRADKPATDVVYVAGHPDGPPVRDTGS